MLSKYSGTLTSVPLYRASWLLTHDGGKAYDQQMHPTVPLPPPNQLQVQSQHLTEPLYQQ